MSEMGWDKQESGVERNNVGSANVAAPSPELIKAFLNQLCQGETFRSWGIWSQPQPLLAVSLQQQGPLWTSRALFLPQKTLNTEKGTGTMQVWAQKQPGSLVGCQKWRNLGESGSSQGTGRCLEEVREQWGPCRGK